MKDEHRRSPSGSEVRTRHAEKAPRLKPETVGQKTKLKPEEAVRESRAPEETKKVEQPRKQETVSKPVPTKTETRAPVVKDEKVARPALAPETRVLPKQEAAQPKPVAAAPPVIPVIKETVAAKPAPAPIPEKPKHNSSVDKPWNIPLPAPAAIPPRTAPTVAKHVPNKENDFWYNWGLIIVAAVIIILAVAGVLIYNYRIDQINEQVKADAKAAAIAQQAAIDDAAAKTQLEFAERERLLKESFEAEKRRNQREAEKLAEQIRQSEAELLAGKAEMEQLKKEEAAKLKKSKRKPAPRKKMVKNQLMPSSFPVLTHASVSGKVVHATLDKTPEQVIYVGVYATDKLSGVRRELPLNGVSLNDKLLTINLLEDYPSNRFRLDVVVDNKDSSKVR